MADFSFRVRLRLAQMNVIDTNEPGITLLLPGHAQPMSLASVDQSPLRKAKDLVLRCSGWSSAEVAEAAAKSYITAVRLAFMKMRMGADFDDRSLPGGLTTTGLHMLEEGSGHRVLKDVHGIMVFETDPPPLIVGPISVTLALSHPVSLIKEAFHTAVARPVDLTDRDHLALSLFHASFFEPAADSRFITLVTVVEALLEPASRSAAAIRHIEELIKNTAGNDNVTTDERKSLINGLNNLKQRSIGSAGRALAREHLGEREYMGMPAERFFAKCYSLRSRLVHGGEPRPSLTDVSSTVASLEVFVSDLLSERFFG